MLRTFCGLDIFFIECECFCSEAITSATVIQVKFSYMTCLNAFRVKLIDYLLHYYNQHIASAANIT